MSPLSLWPAGCYAVAILRHTRRAGAFAMISTLAAALVLSACSNNKTELGAGSPYYPGSGPLPYGGGVYKVGNPYEISGRTYYPREDTRYDQTGIASWYGEAFHRRQTANGEWFDMNRLTAAHPTLPLPVYARVTNLENDRTVIVRINDRGPYAHDRLIDLSRAAADELGFQRQGTARVRVQYVSLATLDDDGSELMAMNDRLRSGMLAEVESATGDQLVVGQVRGETPATDGRSPAAETQRSTNFASSAATQNLTTASTGAIAPGTTSSTVTVGRYYIQAASFSSRSNALTLQERLRAIGNAIVDESIVGGRTYYRVRVGPLDDQGAAERTLHNVRAAGHQDARIVSN